MFEKLQTGEKSMMHQDSLEPAAIQFTFVYAYSCMYMDRWSEMRILSILCVCQ